MDLITGIPNEIFGTNIPSMTSMCIQSHPASSILFTSAPKFAKSADKIDGDNLFIFFSSPYIFNIYFFPFLLILYKVKYNFHTLS